uniref:Sodium channel protein n=1 Tax=Petromyzon marinus TaxID=7757 RepID=S4RRY1_PETMA
YIFTAIYTGEFLIKTLARGFVFHPYSYLRNAWNWLDFIVIILAYMTIAFPFLPGLSALRAFRALKMIAILPALKTIVGAIFKSAGLLLNVMLLMIFALIIISLFGLQIFRGVLRQKCVFLPNPGTSSLSDAEWSNYVQNKSNWLITDDIEIMVCGNGTGTSHCPANYTCLPDIGENPNHGATSFDNFGWAMMTSFQIITIDYWENCYNMVLRASGQYFIGFFIVVIMLGGYYVVNLVLAVVASSYERELRHHQQLLDEEKKERAEAERKQRQVLPHPSHRHDCAFASSTRLGKLEAQHEFHKCLVSSVVRINLKSTLFDKTQQNSLTESRESVFQESPALACLASRSTGTDGFTNLFAITPTSCGHLAAQWGCEFDTLTTYPDRYVPLHSEVDGTIIVLFSCFTINADVGIRVSQFAASKIKSLEQGDPVPFVPVTSMTLNYCGVVEALMSVNKEAHMHMSTRQSGDLSVDSSISQGLDHLGAGSTLQKINTLIISTHEGGTPGHTPSYREMTLLRPPIASHVPPCSLLSVRAARRPRERLVACLNSLRCCSAFVAFRQRLRTLVTSSVFETFITILIITNTVMMAIDYYNAPYSSALDIGNTVLTTIFIAEAVLKLTALFPRVYFHLGWNIFDFCVVITSVVEWILDSMSNTNINISIIRTFRILRVFKLAKKWKTLNLLIRVMKSAIGEMRNLTVIFALVIYIFAVIGMQLIGRDYYHNRNKFSSGQVPRWNFLDFYSSFLMVFRVLCGEWIEPLYECLVCSNIYYCIPLFILTYIVGGFLVLNLFLALLLASFGGDNLKCSSFDSSRNAVLLAQIYFCLIAVLLTQATLETHPGLDYIYIAPAKPLARLARTPTSDDFSSDSSESIMTQEVTSLTYGLRSPKVVARGRRVMSLVTKTRYILYYFQECENPKWSFKNPQIQESKSWSEDDSEDESDAESHQAEGSEQRVQVPPCFSASCICCCHRQRRRDSDVERAVGSGGGDGEGGGRHGEEPSGCCGGCVGAFHAVRRMVFRLCHTTGFNGLVLFMVIMSSFTLTLDDKYNSSNAQLMQVLRYMDIFYMAFFSMEMFLKMIGLGLHKYFTSFWTLLDCFLVLVSWLNQLASAVPALKSLRSLRTLRALRPLRAISRWKGMRLVVNALVTSIPSISNVMLMCLLFWMVFGIAGVQLFGGKFFRCIDAEGNRLPATEVANRTVCESLAAEGYLWVNAIINYDNILSAYLALLQVATLEGWIEQMADASDSTGVDQQPSYNANIYSQMFFIIFVIIGSFFILNLFIGVVIDNFNSVHKREGALMALLTEDQQKFYKTMRRLYRSKPSKSIPQPQNRVLRFFYLLVHRRLFEYISTAVISLNMVMLASEHYKQSESFTNITKIINLVFTGLFMLEAALKILGNRIHYFRQPWDIFDFFVVCISLTEIVLETMASQVNFSPAILRVFRVVRLVRLLRLIRSVEGIRKLIYTLVISLPALINIGLLLLLIMFMYGVLGVSIFRDLPYSGSITNMVNFETFANSMTLLFRLNTAGGWNDVMGSVLGTKTQNAILVIAYFTTFVIFSNIIIINMYVAIILENFNEAQEQEETGVTDDDIDMFYRVWGKFDPLATQFLACEQLPNFFDALKRPFRIPKPNTVKIAALQLAIVEGNKVHCLDVLKTMTRVIFGRVVKTEHLRQLSRQAQEKVMRRFPLRRIMHVVSTTLALRREEKAAHVIQRAFRHWRGHQ